MTKLVPATAAMAAVFSVLQGSVPARAAGGGGAPQPVLNEAHGGGGAPQALIDANQASWPQYGPQSMVGAPYEGPFGALLRLFHGQGSVPASAAARDRTAPTPHRAASD